MCFSRLLITWPSGYRCSAHGVCSLSFLNTFPMYIYFSTGETPTLSTRSGTRPSSTGIRATTPTRIRATTPSRIRTASAPRIRTAATPGLRVWPTPSGLSSTTTGIRPSHASFHVTDKHYGCGSRRRSSPSGGAAGARKVKALVVYAKR